MWLNSQTHYYNNHDHTELVRVIKFERSGIVDICVERRFSSFDTWIGVKFNTDDCLISDSIQCFLQSKDGKEYLDQSNFKFDYEEEFFYAIILDGINSSGNAAAASVMKITAELVEINYLCDNIIQSVKNDHTYFDKREKEEVVKHITKQLGQRK